MTLALRVAARSDRGLVHPNNDDSGYAGPNLLAIADGMGGPGNGDVASTIAITAIRVLDRPGDDGPSLSDTAALANQQIADRVAADPRLEGMGTTLTALLFRHGRGQLLHVGDSRAYLRRDGELVQLTHDHSFVQNLVDEGKLTARQARSHPYKSLITRVLDGRADLEPDLRTIEVRPSDQLLLCSDGLDNAGIDDDQIDDVLATAPEPDDAAARLVELALAAGAPDNVSCVVAFVVDAPDRARPPVPDRAEPPATAADGAAAGAEANGAEPAGRASGVAVGAVAAADGAPAGPEHTVAVPLIGTGEHEDEDAAERLRYAPRQPGRWRWARWVGLAVVVVGVLVGLGWGGYAWSQTQYYVGTYPAAAPADGPGGAQVAVYRGLSQQVLGLHLSHVYEVEDLHVAQLPEYHRQRVERTISADNLAEARSIVAELRKVAAACPAPVPPTGGPTATPTPGAPTPTLGAPSPTPGAAGTAGTGAEGPGSGPAVDCAGTAGGTGSGGAGR